MRKVILSFGMSLDGYIARPDGAVDFLVNDADARKIMAEFFPTIDTAIMGRKTLDDAIRMMGGTYKAPVQLETYVLSRSLAPGKFEGYEVVRNPTALVEELRRRPGKHIFNMGGGELGRSFLEADLVDELFLGIVPVLLGAGRPAFPGGFPQREFRLTEHRAFSGSSVLLRYERCRIGS